MSEFENDQTAVKDMPRPTYTTVELRLPGRNTLSELAEVLNPDLQECVSRVTVVDPNELYF